MARGRLLVCSCGGQIWVESYRPEETYSCEACAGLLVPEEEAQTWVATGARQNSVAYVAVVRGRGRPQRLDLGEGVPFLLAAAREGTTRGGIGSQSTATRGTAVAG